MYYNESADRLFVCSLGYQRIDIFNHGLTFIESISMPYFPVDIDSYGDYLLVAANNSIFIFQNNMMINNFTIIQCNLINAIIIDKFENIAIACNSNIIYIYLINGTYLGVFWTSPVSDLSDMSFDSMGDLILTAPNGVFVINNQTILSNKIISGISTDNDCIINSKILILLKS
jgi:hypothetical protein